MSKHTPGPWEYVRETEYMGGYPYTVAHKVKVGRDVLTVGCHGHEWEPGKEMEANAHLVAAAPELYEACKEFVRKCECGEARSHRSYAQMKAALAKAEAVER